MSNAAVLRPPSTLHLTTQTDRLRPLVNSLAGARITTDPGLPVRLVHDRTLPPARGTNAQSGRRCGPWLDTLNGGGTPPSCLGVRERKPQSAGGRHLEGTGSRRFGLPITSNCQSRKGEKSSFAKAQETTAITPATTSLVRLLMPLLQTERKASESGARKSSTIEMQAAHQAILKSRRSIKSRSGTKFGAEPHNSGSSHRNSGNSQKLVWGGDALYCKLAGITNGRMF